MSSPYTRFGASLLRAVFGPRFADRLFAHPLDRARTVRLLKGGIAGLAGRTVRCSICGQRIGRVLAVARKGRVELWGMDAHLVRVDFEDRACLRFSHAVAENCAGLRHYEDRP